MSTTSETKIRCAACRELFLPTALTYNGTREDLLCRACDRLHQPSTPARCAGCGTQLPMKALVWNDGWGGYVCGECFEGDQLAGDRNVLKAMDARGARGAS